MGLITNFIANTLLHFRKPAALPGGNTVQLVGFYGDDRAHALSAWTSTSRELGRSKKRRIGKLLGDLASAGHHTPFEKSMLHFLVRVDTATHIHLLKHRIAVPINGESARYKRLAAPTTVIPSDWPAHIQQKLHEHFVQSVALYSETVEHLTPLIGRARAKESARFFLPYCSQLTLDVAFNWRSFYHFLKLRNKPEAQKEVREVAAEMLRQVRGLFWKPFRDTIKAFGL